MGTPLLMKFENNIYLEGDKLVIIDRRRLPSEIVPLYCRTYEDVALAIEKMAVQGAGDIAVAAGFGLYLAARETERKKGKIPAELKRAAARLEATRPTGFHLKALLNKIMTRVEGQSGAASDFIHSYLQGVIARQDSVSRETGKHAETLLVPGDTILTHCFAGAGLLYMLQFARDHKKEIKVICTETRPYLQGARLTAWSVSELGLDTTLITDNMAAHFMSKGMISKIFTAADRISMDGTVANKIGTLQLAICAEFFRIPFYVLAYGGPDRGTPSAEDIPIEERDPEEVLLFQGIRITGPSVKAFYPAFDLTPARLITGVVTSSGVISLQR